jgi:hypothetical protein
MGLLGGIWDVHHDLHVGPCNAKTIAKEASCPLVDPIGVIDEDGFDCTHAEWVELFRDELHRFASAESTGWISPEVVLSGKQLVGAFKAQRSGKPLKLDGGRRIEPREGGWIVVDRRGSVLVEIEDPGWGPDGDPKMPPLRFLTPKEALIGLLRSETIATARSERYEAAMERLGRE